MKTLILILSSCTLLGLAGCGLGFDYANTMANTKWELYGYKDASLTQMLPLADTLEFSSVPNYRYNHVSKSYSTYSTNNGNQNFRLQLNDTRFGTVSGVVQVASVNSGTILAETFTRATDNVEWQFWFRKIN